MSSYRDVFAQNLRRSIEETVFARNRRELCRQAGISTTTLSQYEAGKTTPRLEVLIRLTHVLNIPLDQLVLGERITKEMTPDVTPLLRQLERIERARNQELDTGKAQTELFQRVVRSVSNSIENEVKTLFTSILAKTNKAVEEASRDQLPSGYLRLDDTRHLERHAEVTFVFTRHLVDDVLIEGDDMKPGAFAHIVAENIRRGRRVRILIPHTLNDYPRKVAGYKQLLARECPTIKNIQFRVTRTAAIVGYVLYKLDLQELTEDLEGKVVEAHLQSINALSDDGWIGIITPCHARYRADTIMDKDHLSNAHEEFGRIWQLAKSV